MNAIRLKVAEESLSVGSLNLANGHQIGQGLRLSLARLFGGSVVLNPERVAVYLDDVFRNQLSASPGLYFAIHLYFAALDHHLGLAARSGDRTELHELVQAQRLNIRTGIVV
jgi:hypothetical protein